MVWPTHDNPHRAGILCDVEGCMRDRRLGSWACSKAHAKQLGEWYCKGAGHNTRTQKTTRGMCPDCCLMRGFAVKFPEPKKAEKLEKPAESSPVDWPPAGVDGTQPAYLVWFYTVHQTGPLGASERMLLKVLEDIPDEPFWALRFSETGHATFGRDTKDRALTAAGIELLAGLRARNCHASTKDLA